MGPQHEEQEQKDWRPVLIGGMWVVLIMIIGWIAADASSARAKMTEETNNNSQRIAILEEANRNMRDTLIRIERGVEDLRSRQEARRQ